MCIFVVVCVCVSVCASAVFSSEYDRIDFPLYTCTHRTSVCAYQMNRQFCMQKIYLFRSAKKNEKQSASSKPIIVKKFGQNLLWICDFWHSFRSDSKWLVHLMEKKSNISRKLKHNLSAERWISLLEAQHSILRLFQAFWFTFFVFHFDSVTKNDEGWLHTRMHPYYIILWKPFVHRTMETMFLFCFWRSGRKKESERVTKR